MIHDTKLYHETSHTHYIIFQIICAYLYSISQHLIIVKVAPFVGRLYCWMPATAAKLNVFCRSGLHVLAEVAALDRQMVAPQFGGKIRTTKCSLQHSLCISTT